MKHLLIGNQWFSECSKLFQESLLVAWLGISPQEVRSNFLVAKGKRLRRDPLPGAQVSMESQQLAFMVTDMLTAQLEKCETRRASMWAVILLASVETMSVRQ
jgi:hypothetical protein